MQIVGWRETCIGNMGKEFHRDAVPEIKLLEWLFFVYISANQECMAEKKQKAWFHDSYK